ncbi:RFC checkpoint protein Rad17, partial [Coemansia sp. RSA 2703]
MSCRARTRRLTRGRTQVPTEVICVESHNNSDADADMDLDFAFDSELQALIDECSAPAERPLSHTQNKKHTVRQRPLTARRRFRLAGTPQSSQTSQPSQTSQSSQPSQSPQPRPNSDVWWRQYAPQTVEDLAVHVKKTAQVRSWLESACASTPAACFRILVLEGPAGSGKSTCLRTLAHALSLHLVEWTNTSSLHASPASLPDFDDSADSIGVVRQFGDFLARAARYEALGHTGRRVILVDDLPNVSHPATRESFGHALQRFAHLPAASSCPLVLVVSDTTSDDQSGDSVCGGADVMPRALYDSALVQAVRFNPVAPTIVTRGLRRVLKLAGRDTALGDAEVRAIAQACGGDMRSAVTMLQLAVGHVAGAARGRKRRRSADRPADVAVAGESRRVAVDLFHAAARVLHAKRVGGDGARTRGQLECDAAEILSTVAADAGTLQHFVYENHVDFCASLEEAAASAEWFSQADAMAGGMRLASSRGSLGAQVADTYAPLLALQGAMHVRAHPMLTQGAQAPRVSRGMTALRKPQFFEYSRAVVANQRLFREFAADRMACAERVWRGGAVHE